MKGIDDLKRKQLTELSILNGTYRPSSASSVLSGQSPMLFHHHQHGVLMPSTPSTPFVYTPSPMAYVPPQRRHSQQQMMMQATPPSVRFYSPSAIESPMEFVDPGIEEMVSAIDSLLLLFLLFVC
jgi:hypothetical protein